MPTTPPSHLRHTFQEGPTLTLLFCLPNLPAYSKTGSTSSSSASCVLCLLQHFYQGLRAFLRLILKLQVRPF